MKIKSYSVLRYPGGKSKIQKLILPFLEKYLNNYDGDFYEPFTGGASISLTVAANYPNKKIYLNDLDLDIFNFWNFMVNADEDEYYLFLKSLDIDPTIELYNKLVKEDISLLSFREKAFHTLVLNRTSFGGKLYTGPIGGQKQNTDWAIDCVYGRKKLPDRLNKIRQLLVGRTTVTNIDFSDIFFEIKKNDIVYIDPPYYSVGDKYYPIKMAPSQHKWLSKTLKDSNLHFVLSYDNVPEVLNLYNWATIKNISCLYNMKTSYKNGDKNELSNELIIYKKEMYVKEEETGRG